ncbi:MAG: GWxTD domain-containing protein [Candidatus Aminicenantaceae bacterium]
MKRSFFVILLSFFILLPACRLYKLERQLKPEYAEFLSKVRYIVTGDERKIFLETPDSEKDKFIEEFWKRRDPDPDTEVNEFKIEYLNRIERSNELFLGEGRPGWMTDRGRIYVLFGPPTDRLTYPMGGDPYSRCREIWYYGNFPVLFLDYYCNGSYELVTLNLSHLHDLNLAQSYLSKTFKREKGFFDFTWDIKKTYVGPERIEGIITIRVPYEVIWFKTEDDKLVTTLDVNLELKDSSDSLIWEYQESFTITIDDFELREKRKKDYEIEIPFALEEGLEKLHQGKNLFHILIKNRTGAEELEKTMEFWVR